MFTELLESRLPNLSIMEMTYLSKGLLNLKHLLNPSNKSLDSLLCDKITNECLLRFESKQAKFDPYSISKLMRYMSRHPESPTTLKLYSYFIKELVETIS